MSDVMIGQNRKAGSEKEKGEMETGQELFKSPFQESHSVGHGLLGVGFTCVVALLGFGLAKVPGLGHIGPLACAILLAVIYRQIWGYPEILRLGIQFSAKRLLRLAIILLVLN